MTCDLNDINFVIYHKNCMDGMGSAYAAWKFLGDNAEYFAASHGNPPPDVKNKNVVILDFSYKRNILKKMMLEANSLTVIDHHISAFNDLKDLPGMIFDMKHSGAVLSWKYFHNEKPAPKFIKYIEDRDLWKWELPDSRDFSAFFQTIPYKFMEYERFENDALIDDAIAKGKMVHKFIDFEVGRISKRAVSRKLAGFNIKVVNTDSHISETGSRLSSSENCDVAFIWYHNHKNDTLKVSLRSSSDQVDVSKIAKLFGGGGHARAAGFVLPGGTIVDNIFNFEKYHK